MSQHCNDTKGYDNPRFKLRFKIYSLLSIFGNRRKRDSSRSMSHYDETRDNMFKNGIGGNPDCLRALYGVKSVLGMDPFDKQLIAYFIKNLKISHADKQNRKCSSCALNILYFINAALHYYYPYRNGWFYCISIVFLIIIFVNNLQFCN